MQPEAGRGFHLQVEVTASEKWLSRIGCGFRLKPGIGLAALGLLGLATSGCVSGSFSFYNFVNSAGADMYFKVPSNWSDFGPSEVFGSPQQTLTPGELSQVEAGNWANVFSGLHTSSIQALTGIFANQPFGITQATKLSTAQRDTFSLASLRTLLLPSDPLGKTASTSGTVYTAQSYSEFVTSSGMRGSRMVVDVKQPGKATAVLQQIAEIDATTNWVYLIGVGCSQACYKINEPIISEIVDSWSVRSVK